MDIIHKITAERFDSLAMGSPFVYKNRLYIKARTVTEVMAVDVVSGYSSSFGDDVLVKLPSKCEVIYAD